MKEPDTHYQDSLTHKEIELERRLGDLQSKVLLLEQKVNWMESQVTKLEEYYDIQFSRIDIVIEQVRSHDLVEMSKLLGDKLNKHDFGSWKEDIFKPIQVKVESFSYFQTRLLMIGTLLSIIIPSLLTFIIRYFLP